MGTLLMEYLYDIRNPILYEAPSVGCVKSNRLFILQLRSDKESMPLAMLHETVLKPVFFVSTVPKLEGSALQKPVE